MKSMQSADKNHDAQGQRAKPEGRLDGRYGKIGISAVAAAVRCRDESETKTVVYSRFALNDND
jgi:hypothetical protein